MQTDHSIEDMASSSLRGPVFRGGAWMVAARWSLRLIGLVNITILARLLVPADFGLLAIAIATLAILEAFASMPFGTALIRFKDATPAEYDTAWSFNVLRGFVLAVILIALGPFVASAYDDPRLTNVLFVLAMVSVVEGIKSVGLVQLSKDLLFGKLFVVEVVIQLGKVLATIIFALILRNYWALVLGMLAGSSIGVIASFAVHPYRPKLNLSAWHRLLGFSIWLSGAGILSTTLNRLNIFLLGAFVPLSGVGIFNVGNEIGLMVSSEISGPVQRVLYPGFAKISDTLERLNAAYQLSVQTFLSVGLPIGVGFVLVAPEFIELALGKKWLGAVPVVQIIALSSAIGMIFNASSSVLPALGHTKRMFQIMLVTSLVGAPATFFLIKFWGLLGAALAGVVIGNFWGLLQLSAATRALNTTFFRPFVNSWRSFVSVFAMVAGIAVAVKLILGEPLINFDSWKLLAAFDNLALMTDLGSTPQIGSTSGNQYSLIWLLLLLKVGIGVVVYPAIHALLWMLSGKPDGAERFILEQFIDVLKQWMRKGRDF